MKKVVLIVGMLIIIFSNTKSQVIFTDVHPDKVLNQVTPGDISYYVDMTNDGDTDFQIINSYTTVGDSTYSQTMVLADSGNAVATDGQKNPLALTAGTLINGSYNWNSEDLRPLKKITSAFGINSSFAGLWIDATDRFLGVRFNDNDTMKYGWIEMIMNTNQVTVVTTILDYAYENSGSGILTQDSLGAIGLNDVLLQSNLSVSSFQNIIRVASNGSNQNPILISVSDILGMKVKEFTTQQREFEFDLSSFPGKIFIVSVQQGNEITRKKILVF